MGSDPGPRYATSFHNADGPIVIADSDCKQVVAASKSSKMQGRVRGRCAPQIVVLFSEALNLNGQLREEAPELL